MRTIAFVRSPAFATLGEALSLAARYWRATWDRWLLAVLAVALATGLAEALLGGTVIDQRTMSRALLPGTQGQIDPAELPRLMAGPLAVGVVSIVAGWFLLANAVSGLRGSEITLRWVVSSGLRALAAAMLVALVFVGFLAVATGLGPIGILVLLAAMPLVVYAALRLVFWTIAIFDGSTIGVGARTSWGLTRNAVLRVLGWELALFGIGFLLAITDLVLSFALGFAFGGVQVAGRVIASAAETALQAFTIIVIAILYESQRLRTQPPPAIAYPSEPYDPEGPYPPPPPQG
jgi:hypothetical protein